jgi:hypothetical protein
MIVFHGTSAAAAARIVGPPLSVDVTRGGGELGCGFYTGDSISLAVSWAKGRFGASLGKAIQIDVDNSAYAGLNVLSIGRQRHIWWQWKYLAFKSRTATYLFGYDAVCAPFATLDMSLQIKFESAAAQNVLNTHSLMRVL